MRTFCHRAAFDANMAPALDVASANGYEQDRQRRMSLNRERMGACGRSGLFVAVCQHDPKPVHDFRCPHADSMGLLHQTSTMDAFFKATKIIRKTPSKPKVMSQQRRIQISFALAHRPGDLRGLASLALGLILMARTIYVRTPHCLPAGGTPATTC